MNQKTENGSVGWAGVILVQGELRNMLHKIDKESSLFGCVDPNLLPMTASLSTKPLPRR